MKKKEKDFFEILSGRESQKLVGGTSDISESPLQSAVTANAVTLVYDRKTKTQEVQDDGFDPSDDTFA